MERIVLKGKISVNCYILVKENRCVIVDPGSDKKKIITYIQDKGYEVDAILLTHAHFDHIGALDCFDVPIYIHENEVEILLRTPEYAAQTYDVHFGFHVSSLQIKPFQSGNRIPFLDTFIETYDTPGHTQGGVCYYYDGCLYTGDTLFAGAVGKWEFATGNLEQLKQSIVFLVEHFDEDVLVLPGHGYSSTIGKERIQNQYYLSWKK